jgi:hypothetical protein
VRLSSKAKGVQHEQSDQISRLLKPLCAQNIVPNE